MKEMAIQSTMVGVCFLDLEGRLTDCNAAFVRIWRGLDEEGAEQVEVNEKGEATLVLWAPDYDGTNKAWIRFPDGSDAITGGSQIIRS